MGRINVRKREMGIEAWLRQEMSLAALTSTFDSACTACACHGPGKEKTFSLHFFERK